MGNGKSKRNNTKGNNIISETNDDNIISIIISGYMRINFSKWCPNIIIHTITMFNDLNNKEIGSFNVFNQHFRKQNNENTKISKIFINGGSQYYITNNDIFYVSGANDYYQLGLGNNKKQKKPVSNSKFEIFSGERIKFMSHGISNSHVFIYSIDNKLYGIGLNDKLQIGLMTKDDAVSEPIDWYTLPLALKQIECGVNHSLFLTEEGVLCGCGYNSISTTAMVFLNQYPTIRDSHGIIKSNYTSIAQIACGAYNSYWFNKMGILRSCGSNSCGQLGKGSIYGSYEIVKVNIDKYRKNIMISSGLKHVGAITNIHKLYMFGDNRHGQCGPNLGLIHTPTLIEINVPIISVKCGDSFTIIKGNDGHFYSFGMNKNKQLLLENKDKFVYIPTKISFKYIKHKIKSNKYILDIIPGNNQTFILQRT